MVHRIPAAALLAPTLLLAACGGTENRGLESVHQPVVSRTDYVLDVQTTGSGLAPGERERLAGWMQSIGLGYGDRVYVDDGGSGDAAARAAIAREASRYGLLLSDTAPITTGPIAPGTARVVLTRTSATVPGCPDFSRATTPNFDAHTSSNHGCAVNSNLAAMVARPEDLVRGQPGAETSDPATAVKAIQTFREAKPSGAGGELEEQSTTKGE